MTMSSGWWRIQVRRSGTTASIVTSSTRKATQVTQLRTTATSRRVPWAWDSVSATVGIVSAAAISIGVFSSSRTRVLRASIPGSYRAGRLAAFSLTATVSTPGRRGPFVLAKADFGSAVPGGLDQRGSRLDYLERHEGLLCDRDGDRADARIAAGEDVEAAG